MATCGASSQRSWHMSRIRARGNKTTEVRLRMLLVRSSIKGWRMHPPAVPGRPDFEFPRAGIAVFVDGCFWHGCPRCFRRRRLPHNNRPYWTAKVDRNRRRDRTVTRMLRRQGWRVVRLWEHSLRDSRKVMARLLESLASASAEQASPRRASYRWGGRTLASAVV